MHMSLEQVTHSNLACDISSDYAKGNKQVCGLQNHEFPWLMG